MPGPSRAVRLAAALLLAATLALLFSLGVARRVSPAYATAEASPYSAFDADGDYRRRLTSLTLVHARAPRSDSFVEPGLRSLPWPPLAHALAALTVAWGQGRADAPELGGYPQASVDRVLMRFTLALSTLAAIVAAALAAWLSRASPVGAARAAVTAAGWVALSPVAVANEHATSFSAHGLIVLLALGELAWLAFALRSRERVDGVLGALGAGVCAGAGLAAGWESWPIAVAAGATLVVLALRAEGDARRDSVLAPILFTLAGISVWMAVGERVDARELLPAFDGRARGWITQSRPFVVIAALAGAAVLRLVLDARRDPFHAALLAAGTSSLVLAFFDPRFSAPAHATCGLGAGLVLARGSARAGAWDRKLAWCAVLAALLLFMAWPGRAREARERDERERDAFFACLEWLRESSAAPGPFNHPDGAQRWRVASAPRLAGPIAHRARRPTLAIEHAHRGTAASARLADAFALPDAARFTQRMDEFGAGYVLVCAAMLTDPTLASAQRDGSLLPRLLDPRSNLPGWSLAFEAGRDTPTGGAQERASCAVWRRDASPSPPSVGVR